MSALDIAHGAAVDVGMVASDRGLGMVPCQKKARD